MDPIIEPASQVQTNPQTGIMSKDEWVQKYWFNSLQMVTVINPKPVDWPFMVEMRHFMIPAGATERYPGVIANVYLDQMSKILAQDDEKLGYMSDPSLKRIYYDKLIVDVESLVNEQDPTPDYLKVPTAEKAPWMEEQAPPVPPTAPPLVPELPPEPKPEPKADTKEFEFEGNKFKMITDKNGKQMFYMNGSLTSEANYAKSASML